MNYYTRKTKWKVTDTRTPARTNERKNKRKWVISHFGLIWFGLVYKIDAFQMFWFHSLLFPRQKEDSKILRFKLILANTRQQRGDSQKHYDFRTAEAMAKYSIFRIRYFDFALTHIEFSITDKYLLKYSFFAWDRNLGNNQKSCSVVFLGQDRAWKNEIQLKIRTQKMGVNFFSFWTCMYTCESGKNSECKTFEISLTINTMFVQM